MLLKKFVQCVVLAAFMLGGAGMASAADSGLWTKGFMNVYFQYLSNLHFGKGDSKEPNENKFAAGQRTRMVLEYVKDENLSATLQFEINQGWGYTHSGNMGDASGGRINSDGVNIATKHAYLDWIVPNTALMVRMGIQPMELPWALPGGSSLLDADAAGVLLSYQINEWIGINAFWSRLWDSAYFGDSGTIYGHQAYRHDDWDAFGLVVPLSFEGLDITPYGVYSRLGKRAHDESDMYYYEGYYDGNDAFNGWWAGLSGSLTMFDPFFVNMDVIYGALSNSGRHTSMHGWFGGLQIGYKTDYVTPSIIGFYSSGKRAGSHDGRIPIISGDNGSFGPTTLGTDGDYNMGYTMAFTNGFNGLWGVGLKLEDINFIDELYHTINFMYYRGTSKKSQATNYEWDATTGVMTTKDWAWEVNLENRYNVYENLVAVLEFSYLKPYFDDDLGDRADGYMRAGLFKGALQLEYSF